MSSKNIRPARTVNADKMGLSLRPPQNAKRQAVTPATGTLRLSQLSGNRSVQRLVQRKGRTERSAQHQKDESPSSHLDPAAAPPPSIVSTIHSSPSSAGRAQRMCAECEDELNPVRRKSLPGPDSGGSRSVATRTEAVTGDGQPLSDANLAFFEPRFGCALDHVRIRTDDAAAQSAGALRAHAYTLGSNIVFGPGEPSPESAAGRQLLAHELTHVLQQSHAEVVPTTVQRDSLEGESNEDEGLLGWAANAVETGTNWAAEQGNAAAEWAVDKAESAVEWGTETASDLTESAAEAPGRMMDWVRGTTSETPPEARDEGEAANDSRPELGGIDLSALADQASVTVANNAGAAKLPRLQEAEDLIARADTILDRDAVAAQIDPDLPRPSTGARPDECCSRSTLQSLRIGLDGARTTMKGGIAAFRNAQNATRVACEQAKRTCLLALGGGILGSAIAIAVGAPLGGVAALFAACVACIGAASPVENAIRVEQENYDAMLLNMDALRKALSNYQTCEIGLGHCSEVSPTQAPVMDLGDVDQWPESQPPVMDLGVIEESPDPAQ